MAEVIMPTRWVAGTYRVRTWLRFLPVHIGPLWDDPDQGWRNICGIAVGVGPRAVYVARIKHG